MVGVLSQQQRAWRHFLLQHPMEALEPRMLLNAALVDAAPAACVLVVNPVSVTVPTSVGAVCTGDGGGASSDGGASGNDASGSAPTDSQAPTATPLDASGTASGSITDPVNQTDSYSFQATAGQDYSVQIDTTTLADGCVTIVDQDGVSQLDYAEAVGAGTSGSVVWQAPADGTYYLQVTSGDGQSTGAYSVSVSVAQPPSATPLDTSGSASGDITDPSQTDTYSFQATAGQNYNVQINAATLADGCVAIVDQDGFSQLDWAEAVGTGSSDSVVWQAPADGTYYLQVTSGDGQSTGTYAVSVSVAQPPAATPLDSSGTASGNITDPSQTDTYCFQATAGQNYSVQ
ncbi:MAG: PPC domain-containing protein, partial [Tepidisphaeraceae bacterium]